MFYDVYDVKKNDLDYILPCRQTLPIYIAVFIYLLIFFYHHLGFFKLLDKTYIVFVVSSCSECVVFGYILLQNQLKFHCK